MDENWIEVTPSEFPWERDALAFLKQRLPDHEPYRAWANFEFLLDGTIGEVDVLVVVPKGIFLIEIKSWPGRLEGDAGTWRNIRPGDARARTMDNPLLLVNRKAKRLKSLLARQRAFRGKQVPFVAPLVFLSHPELDCRLQPDARAGIHGLDEERDAEHVQRGGLTGIVGHVTQLTAEDRRRLGPRRIDRPMSARIAQALVQAGIKPSQRRRRVGDLELGELIDEGPGFQDFEGSHPRFESMRRRVRIYGTEDGASADQRQQASRAAQREFELLGPISHPGIVRALAFHEHELGPAIVFERDPGEIRLDHYLQQTGGSLTLHDRLAILRQLAEAVVYAHGRRLFHRGLSPRCVLVKAPGAPGQRLSISNWQTGTRASGATLSSTVAGTAHVEQLVDENASAYLAPEALTHAEPDATLLDVFSLGAIAFHLFTDHPPATSLAGLLEVLQRDGALEVASVLDGAGPNLSQLVRDATAADASRRIATVDELLIYLDTVDEEVSGPVVDADDTPFGSLEEIGKGDRLAGLRVVRRLGRGSTAVAFLVADADEELSVLKVAADPDRNERVREEGEVLSKLDDRTIIAIRGGPIDVDQLVAIALAYASEGTLSQRLRSEGRLLLETLERWGEDLLAAVAYLERIGIPHRDIKPENLGIMELGSRKQRHLVLMDFSLARASAEQIHAGTPPYLDPFLGPPDRPRWDLAADRFAAAMTLHEMAAGTLPRWSESEKAVNPRFAEGEVIVDSDALPREIAGPLAAFLARALRRKASERFDTAEEMLQAWRRMFESLEQTTTVETQDPSLIASERARATFDTPLPVIGLSARATNALERSGALTVGDLLAISPFEFNRLRGVGLTTRKELVTVHGELRARLGTPDRPSPLATRDPETAEEPDVRPLDAVAAQLVPKRTRQNATEVDAIRLLLGLDPLEEPQGDWASQTQIAERLEVTRARVGQVVSKARERWRRLPSVTRAREELLSHLERLAAVAGTRELELIVARERGSGDAAADARHAGAIVRAAVETEAAMESPRWTVRRTGRRVIVASAGDTVAERQASAEYAVRLGAAADSLASAETLAGPTEVSERLRSIRPPSHLALSQERLVGAAATASEHAAVSARLELYPRNLPNSRALALGRAALLGAERLTATELARRIAARFPEAEELPPRPALDERLRDAGIELVYDEDSQTYLAPRQEQLTGVTSFESSITRQATASLTRHAVRDDPLALEAQSFEARLASSISAGGLLTLMVAPGQLAAAGRELRRFDITPVDVDALVIRHLHSAADQARVRWDLVIRTDGADRASQDWTRLMTLVERAMPKLKEELAGMEGTLLLEHLGLLARYDQLRIVDELRDAVMSTSPLHGAWFLVPADQQTDLPEIDGVAVPVLTSNEWARVPQPWLENRHRALRQDEGAA